MVHAGQALAKHNTDRMKFWLLPDRSTSGIYATVAERLDSALCRGCEFDFNKLTLTKGNKMKSLFPTLLVLSVFSASVANAQSLADAIRGGWINKDSNSKDVYVFVVQDSGISGSHCIDCYNPANLGFVDEGELTSNGVHFKLYHDHANGSVTVNEVKGELQGEELLLVLDDQTTQTLIRSPRDTRAAAPSGGFAPAPTYNPPGPALMLTRDDVTGLWLAGTGPGKQYFMFKKHKDGLRGMVCGPCMDASGMAPLENIRIEGTELHYDIVHENSGPGILEHGPHRNVTVSSIARNELHMATRPSFVDESYALIHMTLLGPVQFQP